MSILKIAKFFFALSILAIIGSLVLTFTPGLKLSIEFTGGTLVEIELPEGKTKSDVEAAVASFQVDPPLGNVALSATKDGTVLMRMRSLNNEEHIALLEHLKTGAGITRELQYTTIGPTVGSTLKVRSLWALAVACVAIAVYIAIAFRKIPRRYSPWRFGIVAILTLFHDILITVGIFVILSQWTTFEFDTLFITALLTILGYSVNDTIVIFDRIRDNLGSHLRNESFGAIAERSLREILVRSLNTGVCVLIMLMALFLLGSPSIQWFILALIIGISVGTYSSICLATPLLVFWQNSSMKNDR